MQPKAIIFDFFGVICSEISPFWFEKHFAEKGKELRDQYLPRGDRGEISQQQLFQELAKLAGVSPEEIEKDWIAHAHFNDELIEFIKELRNPELQYQKGNEVGMYKIGLLSNAISPFFHTLIALSGTLSLFDAVVVSSEVGYAKPDRQIYEIILERLLVEPGQALFIDDSRKNVEGAEKIGMIGHLYTSVQDLRDLLRT